MRSRPGWTAVAAAGAVLVALAGWLALSRAGRTLGVVAALRPTIVQDDAQVLHRPPAEVRRTVRTLRALGVDWLRVTAGWSEIAPVAPGPYPPGAWKRLDAAVREARAAGLQVMIDIGFWAPRWAVARRVAHAARQRWGIDAAAYGRFAAAVARRYRRQAIAYTIWNEPNFGVFLLPQWRRAPAGGWEVASADAYRDMLYAAVPAVRREAPGALVLIGGTAALGAEHPSGPTEEVPPLRFLRALACVDQSLRPLREGACARFRPLPGDGWAHHPYSPQVAPEVGDPQPDTATLADAGRLTALLDRLGRLGRTERPLGVWVTEFGYETDPPDPTQPVTAAEQARWLPRAEAVALANPRVRSWSQFLLRDLGPQPGRTERQRWGDFQTGLELPDGRPKPAMLAFATPLVARRVGDRAVVFWGRLRAGFGPRPVRVSAGGDPLRALTTAPDGTFAFAVAADPAATFRIELRDGGRWKQAGLPVRLP